MASDPNDAVEFLREAEEAESENRNQGLIALRFVHGDQWPAYAIASRGMDRPQLTINETATYIRKICNMQRQQRPRGKASPIDGLATKEVAKIITGIGRHIEVNSDADNAYDHAYSFAAKIGWGYWRLRTDYIDEKSFNQDIFIDMIENPFSVYFDKNSKLPDGSDSDRTLLTDTMRKSVFEKAWPSRQSGGFEARGTGDSMGDWETKDEIRLAEFYTVIRKKEKLLMLTDGTPIWESDMPKMAAFLAKFQIGVKGDRMSMRRTVMWRKQTAADILEEKEIPGRFIPVVPVYWDRTVIDSKRVITGLTKDAMDPQRMVNFWQTLTTELIALGPKAKWLIPEGADEGHEKEFQNANLSSSPSIRFKTTGTDGQPIPFAPQRIQAEQPPAGAIEAAFLASQNLSRVMGIFDPAVRGGAQHKSDKTLNAEQGQSENTNFNGYDNLTRSIKHTWRIILGWIPFVYDVKRVQRIIGEDGRHDLVTINEKKVNAEDAGITKVLNDVTVGAYDVAIETGPGYDTRRQEGVDAMMQLLDTPLGEKVAQTADDLVLRQMDFNGSEAIADRMAAANPLAQIDEKSEVPPKVQMMVKALQQQVQQLQQQLQAAAVEHKFGLQKIQIQEDGQTKRALMKETNDAHERLMTQEQKQHDTEVYALTAQNVAEINGLVKLLTSKTEHGQRLREMVAQFEHDVALQDRQLEVKSEQSETVQ